MGIAFDWVRFGYGAFALLRKLSMAVLVTSSAAHAETVTIVAFGDSLTAGYGLAQVDGFVPQLQNWLDGQGADTKIINAGVSGDTTAGGAARIDWTLTPDVDAMIVTLGGNDYLRGIDPAVSRSNLDKVLSAGDTAGVEILLVGLNAGSNYGLEYKTAFDGMYVDLAAQYDVPFYSGFFDGLRAVAGTQEGFSKFMQEDGVHPNKDGVAVIVAAIGPSVLRLIEAVE